MDVIINNIYMVILDIYVSLFFFLILIHYQDMSLWLLSGSGWILSSVLLTGAPCSGVGYFLSHD
jgi:hypothetical protein